MIANELRRVKNNQNSPLLRLPPEIRNRIWEYSLGHSIFRTQVFRSGRSHKAKLTPPTSEPSVGVALLRCCRQIYSEAALMPIRLNTLAFSNVLHIKKATKLLKAHQRKQITMIRVEVSPYGSWASACCSQFVANTITKTLPALKNIEVVVFDASEVDMMHTLEEIKTYMRHNHAQHLGNNGITLTVKELDFPIPSTYYQYY